MIIFVAVCYVCEIPLKDSQMSKKRKRLGSPATFNTLTLYPGLITDLDLAATLEAA